MLGVTEAMVYAKAALFFVAYTKDDVADLQERPLNFSFNGGPGFDQALVKRIEDASGVPGTTTMTAVLAALDALNVAKVAVATSYIESVDNALAEVLQAAGREVVAIRGMGILKSIDMGDLAPETNYRFAREMLLKAEGADA